MGSHSSNKTTHYYNIINQNDITTQISTCSHLATKTTITINMVKQDNKARVVLSFYLRMFPEDCLITLVPDQVSQPHFLSGVMNRRHFDTHYPVVSLTKGEKSHLSSAAVQWNITCLFSLAGCGIFSGLCVVGGSLDILSVCHSQYRSSVSILWHT